MVAVFFVLKQKVNVLSNVISIEGNNVNLIVANFAKKFVAIRAINARIALKATVAFFYRVGLNVVCVVVRV
jgi:hypothetical protein